VLRVVEQESCAAGFERADDEFILRGRVERHESDAGGERAVGGRRELLVADEQAHIARAFGVGAEPGRSPTAAFVVGGDGKIARVFAEAATEGHVGDVVKALESF
jgi:alkyl hydroperoxide reductase subunit AhpC